MTNLHKTKSAQRLWPVAVLLACVMLLVTAATVLAATVFSNLSGPTWILTTSPNGNWVLTGNVTYDNPEKTTCIEGNYTTPGGGTATYGPIFCSTNTSPFTCTIPGTSVANAAGSVTWQLVVYTSANDCNSGRNATTVSGVFAPNGTGPNALTLRSIQVRPRAPAWPLALGAAVAGLGGAAVLWRRRR
jgi:hypothetical protein